MLTTAATTGDLETVKSLATASNCNTAGFMGWTPLHNAASAGHVEIVRHLLELGATPDIRDSENHTPLHLACGVDTLVGHLEVIGLLLDKGALINAVDDGGYTPLHLAITHQQIEIAKILLERGCEVNMKLIHSEFTPFHTACELKDKDLISLLLSHGADPAALDAKKRTGSDIAKENGLLLKIAIPDTDSEQAATI